MDIYSAFRFVLFVWLSPKMNAKGGSCNVVSVLQNQSPSTAFVCSFLELMLFEDKKKHQWRILADKRCR